MKIFENSVEEIDGSMTVMKRNCELCGKPVKRYQRKYDRPYKFVFINITQKPATHYFCSKSCKTKWIFEPKKRQILNLETPNIPNT